MKTIDILKREIDYAECGEYMDLYTGDERQTFREYLELYGVTETSGEFSLDSEIPVGLFIVGSNNFPYKPDFTIYCETLLKVGFYKL